MNIDLNKNLMQSASCVRQRWIAYNEEQKQTKKTDEKFKKRKTIEGKIQDMKMK